ncbi:hypothetical protein [Natrinema amylolyticum]|uniref:hypothetical protein n=1 Tax=Natrinema amylolyticum TaxID=2878679 RepID=UPI001CF95608|nr:hypothetical protein [Natrinema amylolyticum]
MFFTRRHFIGSATLLLGIAGCSGSTDDTPLQELYLEVLNLTDEPHTFHFVLESDDGLGQWQDFELDADALREVVIEPETDREWSGYQVVTSDKRASGSLLGQGDEQTCLQLNCRITDDDISSTMSTDRPLCNS